MLLKDMSKEQLAAFKADCEKKYNEVKAENLKLNMARGKPGADQLELSMGMLDVLREGSDFKSENGIDVRNYGELSGIPECKKLFADILGVQPEEVIVGGSSSLTLMFDTESMELRRSRRRQALVQVR